MLEVLPRQGLVTFDVWGTLVQRSVNSNAPKAAGALAACNIFGLDSDLGESVVELRRRTEGELARAGATRDQEFGEYTLQEVWVHTLKQLGFTPTVDELHTIASAEIEFEVANSTLNLSNLSLLIALEGLPEVKLGIVSDTYYNSKQIRTILRDLGFEIPPQIEVICSCDFGTSKRWGELLAIARDTHSVGPRDHLHIGDSDAADVQPQETAGADAIRYIAATTDFLERFEDRSAGAVSGASVALALGRLIWLQSPRTSLHGQPDRRDSGHTTQAPAAVTRGMWSAGASISPAVLAVIRSAAKRCAEAEDSVLYYLSREGILLAHIHSALQREGLLPGPKPVSLPLSRRATFGASLTTWSQESFMLLWRQYSSQSVYQFLQSLSIPFEPEIESVMQHHGLDAHSIIQYPWLSDQFMSFLHDPQVERHAEACLQSQRQGLLRYCASQGLTSKRGHAFFSDLGWRGSIQDNLSRLLDIESTGTYLGTLKPLNLQPGSDKHGVLFSPDFDTSNGIFEARITVIERLLTPDFDAVSQLDKTGRLITTPRHPLTPEIAGWLAEFHRGILDGCRWILRDPFSEGRPGNAANEEADLGPWSLFTFLTAPTTESARLFGSLAHEENFGVMESQRSRPLDQDWPEAYTRTQY